MVTVSRKNSEKCQRPRYTSLVHVCSENLMCLMCFSLTFLVGLFHREEELNWLRVYESLQRGDECARAGRESRCRHAESRFAGGDQFICTQRTDVSRAC